LLRSIPLLDIAVRIQRAANYMSLHRLYISHCNSLVDKKSKYVSKTINRHVNKIIILQYALLLLVIRSRNRVAGFGSKIHYPGQNPGNEYRVYRRDCV